MGKLQELDLKRAYSSDDSDLLNDFYVPVLGCAKGYDRISGFFSPQVLVMAARGFAQAIKNQVEIRLVTSVKVDRALDGLSEQMIDAAVDSELATWSLEEIQSEIERDYLGVFSYLLKTGMLKMKIAVMENDGIFHQKVGIVRDEEGNAISFSGSNNETVYGWGRNVEEFKVFNNWSIASVEYFNSDQEKFRSIWEDQVKGVKVVDLPMATKMRLVEYTQSDDDIAAVAKRIEEHEKQSKQIDKSGGRSLRDYQEEAIEHWFDHDCISIFAMATGTGKTFTTINAMKRFHQQYGYLRTVVAVPLKTLVYQWQRALLEAFPGVRIINTADDIHWKDRITEVQRKNQKDFIIITTYATFPRIGDFELGEDLLLIADEVHNLTTDRGLMAVASKSYRYKLGLSATPLRIWKPDESRMLSQLFGDNKFEYGIEKALADGSLVPFDYHLHFVELSQDEYADYLALSAKIARMFPQTTGGTGTTERQDNVTLNMLQIQRARIKKDVAEKIPYVVEQLGKMRREQTLNRALIYVDNAEFLASLQQALLGAKIITSRFLGDTPDKERARIIHSLCNKAIDAIVAIKCLDEGVDIPAAQQAFILSNSTEPREYVQRLGRVLRRDDANGKTSADIHDYIVLPPAKAVYTNEFERKTMRNMVKNEIRRARFFIGLSNNQAEVRDILEDKMYELGFDFSDDFDEGEEE